MNIWLISLCVRREAAADSEMVEDVVMSTLAMVSERLVHQYNECRKAEERQLAEPG